MKNFISGILVGIANIIPGVSGGTIIVILGLFDKVMESISNVFKLNISKKKRLESIKFLFTFIIGAGVGIVVFAKILEYLFEHFEMQTLYWFIGLILLSLPMLKKEELKKESVNILFFFLGLLLIGGIAYLNPGNSETTITLNELLDKKFTIVYILSLIALGAISGASMIFPGVSGSMVLLVLGWYHLFKSYVANVTSFEIKVLFPLCLIALGVGLGVILSAKVTNYLLKHYKRNTMSFIFGLIVMSAIVIIPTKGYTLGNTLSSIVMFILGGGMIVLFEYLKKKKAV